MANDYTQTDNYGLSLYGDQTPADFRDGHNRNMGLIDKQMKINNDASKKGVEAKNILDYINWDTQEKAAEWINTAETSEAQTTANTNALTALGAETVEKASNIKKALYVNVVAQGVDNTGATDVTEAIQNIANTAKYGLYFPAGVYKISNTIRFPYNTEYNYGITLDNGANIVATAAMDDMFYLGATDVSQGTKFEGQRISGGIFNGNKLAKNAIHLSTKIRSSFIESIEVINFTKIGIYVDAEKGVSTDTLITNCRIGRVTEFNCIQDTIGIYFAGYDNQVSNCYITDAQTLIKTEGILTLTNCHLFNQKQWLKNNWDTVGIHSENDILFNNLYIDSCHIGVRCKERLTGSNIFIYNYFEDNSRIGVQTPIHRPGYVNINNYITGISIPPTILVQQTNDNWEPEIHGAYDISVKMAQNQYPISYKDALSVYGTASANPTLKLQPEQHNVNAKTGYILGYLAKASDYSSMARVQIATPGGYDFCYDGIINSTAGVLRMKDLIGNTNYALAAGKETTIEELPNIPVIPIYLYNNKTESVEYFPPITITFYSGFRITGWWKYTSNPTAITLTQDLITSSTNANNAL